MRTSLDVQVAIVGGGVTGLAAAVWLERDHGIHDVLVLEGADRAGGKIRTETDDGWILEWGPQGFLDSVEDTLTLAEEVGLGGALVRASSPAEARYIVRDGRLRRVPTSPVAFLLSDLLPLGARLRVLGEPFARRRPEGVDESVAEFARRRIGPGAADVLVDAMVTGVFAGDARRLSLAATFPKMAAMEAEHGSLTRALVAKMRAAKREGRTSSGPSGPGGTLTTFRGGMEHLPRAISKRLADRLLLTSPVERLRRDGDRWFVDGPFGTVRARSVLLTSPAGPTARLLEPHAPDAVAPLDAVSTVPVTVVMLGYDSPAAFGHDLEGFGFLVPRDESLGVLGTLFCHSIFPGQAPAGRVLLRTMVGGAREPDCAALDDDAIVGRVRAAHRAVLGGDPDPDRVWIARWPEAISQYEIGHLGRVGQAEAAARAAGLDLAGSPYRGVAVNECIRRARAAARRLAAPR
jgi:oxygen-dependent protoporphyrinogen oxidase